MSTKKQQNTSSNAIETLQEAKIVKFNDIEERIITLRGEKVLLDSDVAELYGIDTMRINIAPQTQRAGERKGQYANVTNYRRTGKRRTGLTI